MTISTVKLDTPTRTLLMTSYAAQALKGFGRIRQNIAMYSTIGAGTANTVVGYELKVQSCAREGAFTRAIDLSLNLLD